MTPLTGLQTEPNLTPAGGDGQNRPVPSEPAPPGRGHNPRRGQSLMAHWQCISGCGACCRLDPALRGDDLDCLNDEQRRTYLTMVGEDGWCIHFDTGGRRCRIYESRPDFCRVENLVALFAVPAGTPTPASPKAGESAALAHDGAPCRPSSTPALLDPAAEALAIASCRTQIRAEYGGRGRVMKRFQQAIRRTP